MKNLTWPKLKKIIIGLIIFYIILVFSICLYKYFTFAYNGFDLAIFNQVFYNSSLGDFFKSSIHPPSYLGDHFAPIIILLLPIYLIFKSPITLLFIQTLFLSLATIPLYLICKKHLLPQHSLIILLLFLFNPVTLNINLFEFHLLAFIPFFIFWLFYFYDTSKFRLFIVFTILSLLIREDVSFIVFMFGFIAILDKRKLKWILTPSILSVIYFFTSLKIISLFAVSHGYKFLEFYSWLGASLDEIFINFFLKFNLVFLQIFDFFNFEFILGFFLVFLFIPIFRPKYLLLSLGMFLQIALGSGISGELILKMHYGAIFLTVFTISSIFSLKYLSKNKKYLNIKQKYKYLLSIYFIIGFGYVFLTLGPIIPAINNIINFDYGQVKLKSEFISLIPQEASVATTYDFLTPLSSRRNIYSMNYVFLGKTQYGLSDYKLPEDTQNILINNWEFLTYHFHYDTNPRYDYANAFARFRQTLLEQGFSTLKIKNNLSLLAKNNEITKNIIFTHDTYPEIKNSFSVNLDDQIEFLGYNQNNQDYSFFFRPLSRLERPYFIKLDQQIYPLGYGLYPTLSWPENKIIQLNFYGIKKINELEIIDLKGGLELNGLGSLIRIIDNEKSLGLIDLSQS